MRLAACIEYDGSAYYGWQRLSHAASVQEEVERALAKVANHPIQAVCAGRTDSGVHAVGQIIHFDTEAIRPERGWLFGTNIHLPSSIAVRWVQQVDEGFHARFSAQARSYRYVILNRWARPALLQKRAWWMHGQLDANKMHEAAQYLLGEQDFSSFRAAGCQANHARRNIQAVSVMRMGELIYMDIQANAFVYHMVRNIVGTLAAIGMGEHPISWMPELLALQDRRLASETAPADGLYFVNAHYPATFNLPPLQAVPILYV